MNSEEMITGNESDMQRDGESAAENPAALVGEAEQWEQDGARKDDSRAAGLYWRAAEIYLNEIAHGRSGDKGDTSNVCVFAKKPEYYAVIAREVTPEKVQIVRDSDAIFREEIAKAGLDRQVNQYFTILTGVHSVGVMGDERS